MRTALGVRRGIRGSKVPIADWARAVGMTRSNLSDLTRGVSSMQNGPAMERLKRLFDALDQGRVTWRRCPARVPHARACYELEGNERFTPMPNVYSVDFARGALNVGRRDAISA